MRWPILLKEWLSEIQVAATRIWTSTRQLRGADLFTVGAVNCCIYLSANKMRGEKAAIEPKTLIKKNKNQRECTVPSCVLLARVFPAFTFAASA